MSIVDRKLMGGMSLELYLDFKSPNALKDPESLKAIDDWVTNLKRDYPNKIVKTFSIADIVKETNKVMHEGMPEFYRIPDDEKLSAQLLYMFNNANVKDRREVVSDDYSRTHISIMMKNAGSNEYSSLYKRLEHDIEHEFKGLEKKYPGLEINITGAFHIIMTLFDLVISSQIISFGFALIMICIVMIICLGSFQSGLFSILPNLMPAAFTFGILGLLNIPLNADTLVIAPIILGIAVDDTIHFLSHYRESWIESGNINTAIKETMHNVGKAVTFTTFILGFGFLTLIFSDNMGLVMPGALGASAILVALLSDILFLPALIYWLKPHLNRTSAIKIRKSNSINSELKSAEEAS